MTTLSELFPQASSLPGGMTKDPRLLPCYDGTSGTNIYDGTVSQASSVLAFWTELDLIGAVATGSTDDTYKEICNITGSGVLFHVISQGITNTTDDVTFRITVDGTEYVIAKTQTWAAAGTHTSRVVLGCSAPDTLITKYSATTVFLHDFAGASSAQAYAKGTANLVPPSEIINNGMPCLRFDESLIVEVKTTDVPTAFDYGAYCGATYILD
jgi:hypothetical protein